MANNCARESTYIFLLNVANDMAKGIRKSSEYAYMQYSSKQPIGQTAGQLVESHGDPCPEWLSMSYHNGIENAKASDLIWVVGKINCEIKVGATEHMALRTR